MTTGRRLGTWLAGMALVAVPTVAVAQAGSENAPLSLDRLAPGLARTGTVTVTNPSAEPATLAIATLEVTDDDNGCVRPEVRDGDTTCGPGGGELSQWLEVTISDDGEALWSGRFTQLQEDRSLPGVLAPGESRDLDITVALPFEAGNDTMTDQVGFDLRIRTLGAAGEDVGDPEVLGAQASTGGSAHHSGGASVPTLIQAGLTTPAVAAFGVLTDDFPETLFVVLLILAVGLTVRAARHHRDR